MSAVQWVSIGLSVPAITLSWYSVWQMRRTIRSARERIARAESERNDGSGHAARCTPRTDTNGPIS